jgi:ribonuclease HI
VTLIAAADGSALGNPGPAGWAWFIDDDHWASGGWPHGTNNMGELTAVLDLLHQTADVDDDLLIYCDSTYAIKTVEEWIPSWKRRGWKKGDGKPVKNLEIVKALDEAMQDRRGKVRFEWVKGHAGHELNEKADALANAAAYAFKEGREPIPGPGFGAVRSVHEFSVTPPAEPELDLFSLVGEDLPASDEERIVALERSLLTDEVRADPAAVAALLHPDWTEVGRSGRLWSREEILAEIGPLPATVTLEVMRVDRVTPDSVLLLWRGVAASGETTVRSSWWVREGDRWLQRYHQGTAEA